MPISPPNSIGSCATLASIWEATAPKPGNVYRGADFNDLTYVDFLVSATVTGPVLEQAYSCGVGATIFEAVRRTHAAVATNTNLGMLLLLAPLASIPLEADMKDGLRRALASLCTDDTKLVFQAIRLANPGGLGKVDEADVNQSVAPDLSLLEAMRLASDRDLVARQYVNGFQEVFQVADRIEQALQRHLPLSDAIVFAFLQLLADWPDSLIARKCGEDVAKQVSTHAAAVLSQGEPGDAAYESALQEFDFSLRTDGHRRNPGTSADLIAAALFVLLRENRLEWPVKFYRNLEPGIS